MSEVIQQLVRSLIETMQSGGWVLLPLTVVAFGIWYSYLLLFARFKKSLHGIDVHELVAKLERLPREERFEDLMTCFDDAQGVTSRLTRRVIARMGQGIPFRDAFTQCRDAELAHYHYAFYVMGALVTTAPLLGLLGTVMGMTDTFTAFGEYSAVRQQTEKVASGVSTALITTQAGLVAALPGTFGLAHLHRLYKRLRNHVDRCETHLALALGTYSRTGGH